MSSVEASQICNFAYDNMIYVLLHNAESMIAKLDIDIHNTLKWHDSNSLVTNPSKFQVMFLGLTMNQNLTFEINGDVISNSKEVELLGVTIDS